MKNWLDKYGKEINANESHVTLPPNFVGEGTSNQGRNYSPSWGGQFQMGGNLPGAAGHMYARHGAPSNGKYAKKTMVSAQNGQEMQYYQEGLDWQPKTISQDGSIIDDDMGQWNHPGEVTRINSNNITMQGVNYPVLGVSEQTGEKKIMLPEKNYNFANTKKVIEYPLKKQKGGELTKLDQLTNWTNYNKPTKGGWLDNY